MTTKLTLTVEKEIIDLAKAYAGKSGRSLSDIIENYLRALVHKDISKKEISDKVSRLLGSVKAPADFDYKETLGEEITTKYSK